MSKIYINGTAVRIGTLENFTLLQHCELLMLDLPRFCYHDQLTIAGNCRMCVVEVDGIAKPVISCATEVHENMSAHTNTLLVKQAREFVLEFLLVNHPLDCPICDQGGECDLQDITMVNGSDTARFSYVKRSASDKFFGPLIKTVMTRCIHCTRCVRFFDEIAGLSIVGTLGRGSFTEVGTLLSSYSYIRSEVNGNVIDLCPVGALTSKPYSFTSRPWELVSTESIDILDSLCSNIRIDRRGAELTRILPRLNMLLNNEWITDKIRFSINGLKRQRLLSPMFSSYNGLLVVCSWDVALSSFCTEYLARIANTYFFAGHLLDCASFYYFRFLSNALGICNVNVHIGSDSDLRLSYLVSKSLSSLFNDSTVFLIIGLNLKLESPLLNIRLKNSMFATHARVRIGYIGTHIFSNYPIIHLGFCSTALSFFFFGRSFFCYDVDNVICLTGGSVSTMVSSVLRTLSDTAFSTNYIALYSGDINLHELCVLQSFNARSLYTLKSERSFIYLVGSDFARHLYTSNSFVVYQGHHHEAINFVPNLVLPTNSFTEVEGLFVNCQGKYQISSQVISSAGTVLMCEDLTFALYKMVCGRSSDFAYKSVTRMKAKFLPYSVNYISSFRTCSYLQSKRTETPCYLLGALFYIFLRNYYDTDIITRSNSDFYALRYAYNTVHNYA